MLLSWIASVYPTVQIAVFYPTKELSFWYYQTYEGLAGVKRLVLLLYIWLDVAVMPLILYGYHYGPSKPFRLWLKWDRNVGS